MEKKKGNEGMMDVLRFASEQKASYILSVLFATIGAVCQLLPYLVIASAIRMMLSGVRDFDAYLIHGGILLLLWFLRILCHGLSTRRSHVATFSVLGSIRRASLAKLERMSLGDVEARGSGELKNILCERIDSVETTLAHIVPEVSGNLVAVIGMLVYLFVVDWRMGLASLATVPLGLLFYSLMMVGYEGHYGRCVKATKELNDTAVEYIGGIEVIKVFGKAKSSYERFVAAAKEGAQSYIDWMKTCNLYFTFALNIMPATLVSILPIGAYLYGKGSLPLDSFIEVLIIGMGLIFPILQVMSYSDDMAKLGTVLGEVSSILSAKECVRPKEDKDRPRDNGVKLEDVHFGYNEKEVLHGIDMEFKSGSVNAIVGPSGGGKSTIAKLIASFWDVDSGSIKIGGVDVRDMSMETSESLFAYVSQDGFLFDDTVRENIRMGRLSATDEEVEEAARKSGCYDFIMSLENGFDTIVGSSGSHLSGGEKQRLTIARAMLKDAPIIILDEATAYTDPENEAIIQKSVARLVKGKTLIVIAHRLSTITDVDEIWVVDDGRIDSHGKHQELLEKSELYSKLWSSHISVKDGLDEGGRENA